MSRADSSRAAAVSRALRAGGLAPIPSGTPEGREGIKVRASVLGTSSVTVAIDAPGARARLAADVEEVLTVAGYDVQLASSDPGFYGHSIYTVSKES